MAWTAQPATYLASIMRRIREWSQEALSDSQWPNDRLWPMVVEAWAELMDDVNGVGDNPIVIDFDFAVTTAQARYQLPGNMGQFLLLGRRETSSATLSEAVIPRSRLHPLRAGVSFEGPTLKFEPFPPLDETLTIRYIPSGYCSVHSGYIAGSSAGTTASVLNLDQNPDEGYFDRVPNAYVGAVIRVLYPEEIEAPFAWSIFPVQERIITAVDATIAQATLDRDLDFNPETDGLGSMRYEVVPFLGGMCQGAIVWKTLSAIAKLRKDATGAKLSAHEYSVKMRAIRSWASGINARSGHSFGTGGEESTGGSSGGFSY